METSPPSRRLRAGVISIEVRRRLTPALLLLLIAAVCAGIIALAAHLRARSQSPRQLLARLPAQDAVLLYIDFEALRQAGVLRLFEGSDLLQEPEYKAFKVGSGFDYLRDLDWVTASLGPAGSYFLLYGRFGWNTLSSYVTQQGGVCYNTFCRVPGSTPDRKISFFPIGPRLIGLAVEKDEYGALRLAQRHPGTRPAVWPAQPVWLFVPASRVQQTEGLPASARLVARALASTEGVLLAAGPRSGQFEVSLEVACRTGQEAAALAAQLRQVTALLGRAIAAESKQPDPRDLSGVLTAGVFESRDHAVHGRWPLPGAFLEALAGGSL